MKQNWERQKRHENNSNEGELSENEILYQIYNFLEKANLFNEFFTQQCNTIEDVTYFQGWDYQEY